MFQGFCSRVSLDWSVELAGCEGVSDVLPILKVAGKVCERWGEGVGEEF